MGQGGDRTTTASSRFVGVGWTLFDHIVHVPKFPGEDQKIAAGESLQQVGGPSVRALMLLAGFGVQCCLMSAVGDDPAGAACLTELASAGVDVSRVRCVPGPSRFSHVWLSSETGSRTIVYSGAGPEMEGFDSSALSGARALISDTRYPDTVRQLAAAARANGVPVVIDMGSYKGHTIDLIQQADVIIGPASTWERIANELGHGNALDAMKARDGPVCVCTNGASEIVAVKSSQVVTYQPPRVQVADSNGAGDVFLGAFAWEWTESGDLERAVAFAANAAALKCTRVGNKQLPTLADISAFEQHIKAAYER